MSVEFAPNGRVFIAEKSGIIKTYSSLTDTSATVVADLRTKVHNYWDRGMMTIAVDPNYPTQSVHLRVLRARRGDRRHRAALGHRQHDLGRLSRPAGRDRRRLRGERAHLADPGGRRGADRRRSRCWSRTGASSTRAMPAAASSSAPTECSTTPAATARAGRSPTTGRTATPSTHAVTRRGRAGHEPADRRGRAAARAGHPLQQRSPRPQRRIDPHRPGHRRGRPGQPALLEHEPAGAQVPRVRVAQPLPPGGPPGHRRHLGRRRGRGHAGRRSTAWPHPTRGT